MVNTNFPSVYELREFLNESWRSDASSTTQRAAEFLFTHVPVTVMDDVAKRRCGQSIWNGHPPKSTLWVTSL
jgi:hypothetical protein